MSQDFARDVEFQKLRTGDAGIDVARLMLEIAADAYPRVDGQACLTEIDRLARLAAEGIADHAAPRTSVRRRMRRLGRFLFHDLDFRGATDAYYDPRNSYLNELLKRRRGIPISLSILFVELARRIGVEAYGVATPGHFVVGCQGDDEPLFYDPYAGGDVMSLEACKERVEQTLGEPGVLGDEHFQPASSLVVVVRVLRNLKAAYAMEDHWAEVLPIQKRLSLLLPDAIDEQRDLGLVFLRNGLATPALGLLERYLEVCDAEQARAVAPFARSARRMMAELN